ncbi:MAG: TIGR01906 family membrane protein [Anaerolineales bacterium]|nr:TIGR01906 family membrane protein [Anaerolineales bacterium]
MIENRTVKFVFQLILVILVLSFLVLSGIRLLLTDTFVQIEYNLPWFPEDPYGMTKAQRLEYAPIALEFLLNGAEESFLGDLKFDDGTVLFNQRELDHMVDVQVLTVAFLRVWYITVVLLAGLLIWAWRGGWWPELKQMLSTAGWIVLAILGTLMLLMLLSFDFVFTNFHGIFFEGDSWLFYYSDTLIRLFPIRFWQDAFGLVGIFTLLGGLALWLGLREKQK